MTSPIAHAITRPGKEPLLFKDKAKAETMRASLNDATAEIVDLVATTGLSTLPATFNADVQINALELLNRCIADLEIGFVACKRCGDQEDTATLDVMDGLRKLRGMLADTEAAHAKNDHLDAKLVIAADNALRYIASATGLTMQYEPLNAPFSASMLASALVKYKNKEGQEADEKTVSAIVAAETAQAAQAPDPSDEMKNSSLLLQAATDICMQTGESVSDFAKWLADGGMLDLITAWSEAIKAKNSGVAINSDPVNQQLLAALKKARETLQFEADSPGGAITDIIFMMHRQGTVFDLIDSAIAAAEAHQPMTPGLHAIHYRDNWDGEGNTYHLLAILKDDGTWISDDSGKQLIQCKGDAILRVWPLTDGTAISADAQKGGA